MSVDFDSLESLEAVSYEPTFWWNLEITDTNQIRVASLWTSSWQWLCSFFTSQLQIDLRDRVQRIVAPMDGYHLFSARQQIALEKTARIASNPNCWLYGTVLRLPNPPEARVAAVSSLPSNVMPYVEGGRYYNHPGERIWRKFIETLYLLFPGSLSSPTNENLRTWNRVDWEACARSLEPKITWLRHAGLLIQGANINLLFDPTFGFVGPCFIRHTEPPIPLEKMPLIDVVGTSHNHGDHFDRKSLEKLAPQNPIAFVPERLDPWYREHGYQKVEAKTWWQQTVVERDGKRITLTAVPAQHNSQTSLTDRNQSLWMGIMVEVEGQRIYFAGDTAFNRTQLDEIRRHFGPIDIACIPIAPEGEGEVHVDHNEALDAFEVLGAARMIPIHHGAYRTGAEKIEDPLRLFTAAAEQRGLTGRISFLRLGETLDLRQAVQVQQRAV